METVGDETETDGALTGLPRATLAVLAREYLLAGHLQDRAAMPQVLARSDRQTMTAVAIDQWMGASPVYTRRVQRALGFRGDDVPTIFKGLQFDVGAPPQFMDFRYRVDSPAHGEFWLDHCGALMDVEPMGVDFVTSMCHDIEDPTFDATAVATNPRARMRPIHRPPRTPADRQPHCHWRVDIDDDSDPLTETDACRTVASSRAATLDLPRRPAETEGLADYSGPFRPDLQLEDLSRGMLLTVLDEVPLQGHLLVRSLALALVDRFGLDATTEILRAQFRGIAPVVAARLRDALGVQDDTLEGIARVLELHPAFRPTAYVSFTATRSSDELRASVRPCPALEEEDRLSWPALLVDDPSMLDVVVQAVDGRSRCEPCAPRAGEVAAWTITRDPTATPAPAPDEVVLTRASTGADFQFEVRRPLPVVG